MELSGKCCLEFYSSYFLWNLGAPPAKGEIARRPLPDCFQPHLVLRYFCDVLYFTDSSFFIYGEERDSQLSFDENIFQAAEYTGSPQ